MRFISFIVTLFISLPLALFAFSMALSNRVAVEMRLWPFDGVLNWSLGATGAVLLAVGFLCGAAFVSAFAQRTRYRLWQEQRRAKRLEVDLQAAETRLAALDKPAAAPVPAVETQVALTDVEASPYRF